MKDKKLQRKSGDRRSHDRRQRDIVVPVDRRINFDRRTGLDRRNKPQK